MMKKLGTFCAVLFILVLHLSCGSEKEDKKRPDDILAPETMVLVLTDIQLIEGAERNGILAPDSVSQHNKTLSFYHQAFRRYEVGEEEFRNSLNYYKERPEKLKLIYEKVLNELEKREAYYKAEWEKDHPPKAWDED